MAISITKTIPKLSKLGGYSIAGGGSGTTSCKIILNGMIEIIPHTKKSLIKIPVAQSKSTQSNNPSDAGKNYVLDLKKIEDTIVIRGWLEDTPANDPTVQVGGSNETQATTAWEKYWIIRAMCTTGGALANLTIDNVEFKSATQEAFLEDATATIPSLDAASSLNTSIDKSVGRIEVSLSFYIGDAR